VIVEYATGEAKELALRLAFDRRIKLEFHGLRITSDGGLLAYRGFDDALGLTEIATTQLLDGRRRKNTRHELVSQAYAIRCGHDRSMAMH
jgi:Transposase DDE domain group 1